MRERVRCDRSESVFSLVEFDLSGKSEKTIELFIKIFNKRGTRMIDEVGMIDNQHIGVCLNNTDRAGASIFAKNIKEKFISTTGQNITFKVYIYPIDWKDINNITNYLNKSDKNNGYTKQSNPSSNKSYSISDQTEKDFVDNVKLEYKIKNNYDYKMPVWKRYVDITVSVLVLVLASPLFLITIISIKILSPGPVFFKQERVGYMGKTFIMLKFRSMKVGNCTNAHKKYVAGLIKSEKHSDGNVNKPMIKRDNLNSLIPFGKVFRRLCIDELPQLINVIRGEMSLIGPRPPVLYEQEEYESWHNGRFNALPGITGLWQVSGKNRLTFEQMIRLDIRYSRQESFLLDVIIILKTPFAIVLQVLDSMQENKNKEKGVCKYV
ncbi:sugar transferase [Candidatus Scalindua japonica]|nr:sugar transferase [Candidatus Scalindua japonica]